MLIGMQLGGASPVPPPLLCIPLALRTSAALLVLCFIVPRFPNLSPPLPPLVLKSHLSVLGLLHPSLF